MSLFEDNRYRWRETYFVLFDAKQRPKLANVVKALSALNKRFQLTNLNADEVGRVDSLTLISPDDFAALDICYTEGAEVLEQTEEELEDIKQGGLECQPPVDWGKIKKLDGRLDILHFEQLVAEDEEDEGDMLDPSALLIVLGALAKLTGGVAIDPQAGTFITE
jgi:hypothetical protein